MPLSFSVSVCGNILVQRQNGSGIFQVSPNSGICILNKLLINAREDFTGLWPLFGSSVTVAGVCVGGRS